MLDRMKFYFGTPGWGWKLYGIGYGNRWFIGASFRLVRDGEPGEGV